MENSKGWNYDELAEELAWGFIDVNEESFPFLLEEARRRHDGDVVANLASAWFEERDKHSYFELVEEAARLGSSKACFWLGNEYRWGNELPRNFEKAYYYYLQDKDYDWPPIDPEEVLTEEEEGEVTSEWLLSHLVTVEGGVEGESDDDIDWWLFVLGKRPTRSLKCGVADWYMKQGGEENRAKALKLFEESANEGFKFAFFKLIEFYSRGEFKNIEKGRYWFYKAAEHGFDEASFADELGVESLKCRELKKAADKGDCIAAAKLAYAYLHGGYDGGDDEYVCCAKDEEKARHYGVLACMDDRAGQILVNLLDDDNREDQRFLNEVAREARLE